MMNYYSENTESQYPTPPWGLAEPDLGANSQGDWVSDALQDEKRDIACLLSHKSAQPNHDPISVSVFTKDIRVVLPPPLIPDNFERSKRGKIFSFSKASQHRMLRICRNSGHLIRSQICLTYHLEWPEDGEALKKDLQRLYYCLRRKYKGLVYLWVLEFQERGTPHFHFFTDREPEDFEFQAYVAKQWNRITAPGNKSHLQWHLHPSNFFPWDMQSGKYLAKEYMGKEAQKKVPENFQNVGRFWGCSQNMTPVPVHVIPDNNADPYVLKKVIRILAKQREKTLKTFGVRKKIRGRALTFTLPHASPAFILLMEYYNGLGPPESYSVPF